MTQQEMYHNVLVHVSRTWERLRTIQPYQEMPEDNIESVDTIVSIADEIIKDKIIQSCLNDDNFSWEDATESGFSDIYIEELATKLIYENDSDILLEPQPKTWLNLSLLEIIAEYKDSSEDEPLDSDAVEDLIRIIKAKINLNEGNITKDEYERILD